MLIARQPVIRLGRERQAGLCGLQKCSEPAGRRGPWETRLSLPRAAAPRPAPGFPPLRAWLPFLPSFSWSARLVPPVWPLEISPYIPDALLFAGLLTSCVPRSPRIGQHRSRFRFCWKAERNCARTGVRCLSKVRRRLGSCPSEEKMAPSIWGVAIPAQVWNRSFLVSPL